jgi:outer membrane protein
MCITKKNSTTSSLINLIYISNFFICLVTLVTPISGQFDNLVNKSWAKNKQLQSHQFSLDQAQLGIEEAKAMYGPTINGNLQYSLAVGGRSIYFPIGDLLNPAYEAIEKLSQKEQFPTLENQSINFLPSNFYDAKIRITKPFIHPDLAINKEVKQYQYNIKEQEIKAYKRLLSKEVINTSIQITMAKEALNVFLENRKLLEEAKRTTNSMLKNGIALPSALLRIESQLASLSDQEININNDKQNASRYLYFLTNDSIDQSIIDYLSPMPTADGIQKAKREEMIQLDEGEKIFTTLIKKESQFHKPRLGAQLDLGSQAFNFGLSPYALLGLNLDLNIFDNRRNKIRTDQARAALSEHTTKKEYVDEQLTLQSDMSYNNLVAAIAQANTYPSRISSASKVYREVFTKYKEGTANYLELIDAQTQLANTQIQANLAKYTAWLKWSEHLYNTASFSIK